jgi:hypothetical protein
MSISIAVFVTEAPAQDRMVQVLPNGKDRFMTRAQEERFAPPQKSAGSPATAPSSEDLPDENRG